MSERDIEAEALTKAFGDVRAVNGISFHLKQGECYGFLGPNGAGKTTTIRMLYGAIRPDSGRLRVLGLDMATEGRRVREQMGIVPQEETLDRELTVYENLWVYAGYYGISRKLSRPRIEEILNFVQLEEKWNSQIKALSGGMKRRLLIVRALIHRPHILVLDEPTTGLDPQTRHMVWQRLRELRRQGLTIVLTTHYMEEAAQLCDRICLIDGGRFLLEGNPPQLVRERVGDEVIELRAIDKGDVLPFLGGIPLEHEWAGDTLYLYCRNDTPVMERLVANGHREFLRRPATLEDLFLRLTGRELRD